MCAKENDSKHSSFVNSLGILKATNKQLFAQFRSIFVFLNNVN